MIYSVVAESYGRKIPPFSFNYVVQAV